MGEKEQELGADNRAGRRERERKRVERYGGRRRMVVGSLQSALTRSTVRRTAAPTRQVTCMAKKGKQVRVIVTLECTEQKGSGIPGMSRYNTTKNRRNNPDRMEMMKYNKYLKKHTLHREIKK